MLINDGIRHQPEGESQNDGEDEEEEEDELDPRVEVELEQLNKASIEINILEKELDEARAGFRQRLTDAAKSLKQLGKSVGNHIDKARPYFEALSQSKKAQAECQNAAVTYEKACQLHKGARDTIAIAEEKLMNNPGMFDAAWQEMLNNANARILEAEAEKLKNEQLHHEATMAYLELERRASQKEKELRKSVNKARPYFEQRAHYLGFLENQKTVVQNLEKSYAEAKKLYSESLKNLEVISEEIHNKRNEKKSLSSTQRGECVGAESVNESTPPSRRKSTMRRLSEEKIKSALLRQKSGGAVSSGRYRHSLLLDLDIDFDIDDLDLRSPEKLATSPGAKSVDIGCVNLKYYDDYQVLDVAPFLEKEKQFHAITHKVTSNNPVQGITKQRSDTTTSEFLHVNVEHDTNKPRSNTVTSSEFDVISVSSRSIEHPNSNVDNIDSSTKKREPSRKDSKPVLITRFSKIEEMEDEVPLDSLDNLPENIDELDIIKEVNNDDIVTNSENETQINDENTKEQTNKSLEFNDNKSHEVISSCSHYKDDNTQQCNESNDELNLYDDTTKSENCVTCPIQQSIIELKLPEEPNLQKELDNNITENEDCITSSVHRDNENSQNINENDQPNLENALNDSITENEDFVTNSDHHSNDSSQPSDETHDETNA